MVINEISIKNFKSYGNAPQTLKLNTDKGELILLVGGNGMGKCVDKKTLIDIDIEGLSITDETITFFDTMDLGKKFLLYIKENKPNLYEKIKRYRSNRI